MVEAISVCSMCQQTFNTIVVTLSEFATQNYKYFVHVCAFVDHRLNMGYIFKSHFHSL